MHPPEPLSLLRTAIRICRDRGTHLPAPHRTAPRFVAVAEAEWSALFRHLAHVLCQEGFDAVTVIDLDRDPPMLALHLADPQISIWLWPEDATSVTLQLDRGGDPGESIFQSFSYDAIIGGGLVRPIQKVLINALSPVAAAQPPW